MLRISALMLLLGALTSVVVGASAPTFCKCTCFSNYTIIPLGPQHDENNPQEPPPSSSNPSADPPSTSSNNDNDSEEGGNDDLNLVTARDIHKQTRSSFSEFPQDDDNDELLAMRVMNEQMREARRSTHGGAADGKRCPPFAEEQKRMSKHKRSPSLSAEGAYDPFYLLPRMPSLSGFTSWNEEEKRSASASCAQCNRAFCLSYNLPICKDAEEKDVQTMCFQRDSRKDQIIVWGFILGTGGLLGWAGIRRLLEMRENRRGAERRRQDFARGVYRPVGEDTPRHSVAGSL